MNDAPQIPLSSVAPDARRLIQLFRDHGEISFQDAPLATARENYLRGCADNGLPRTDLALVRDHVLPVPDGAIRVREYRSRAAGKTAAILFLHGGGWVIGSLDTHDSLCRSLAKESQAAVFSVDYRLAPEHPFPGPLDDCSAALRWLFCNADALGVDSARLGLAGDSAGGNLAAVLANEETLRPQGCVPQAQALFYPVTDLRGGTPSYRRIVSGFPLTAQSMHWFRNHYVRSGDTFDDPRLSPLLAPQLSGAPLFLLSCGLDPLADEGVAYACRAIAAHVRVEHHHLPAHAHGILTSAGRIPTGHALALRAARFLRAALSRDTLQ